MSDDRSRLVAFPGRKKKPPKIPFLFTPIPSAAIDSGGYYTLSENERLVYVYVCRKTYGFGKESDAIAQSQFMGGIRTPDGTCVQAGLPISRRTLQRAIYALEKAGWLRVTRKSKQVSIYSPTLPDYVRNFSADLDEVIARGNDVHAS